MGSAASHQVTQVVSPRLSFCLDCDNKHRYLKVSFAGLGFLALYLAGKLHLFDHRGNTVRCLALFLIFANL